MLVSHRYRFIFIKTMKTGGTSIEVDLSRIMGPDDIVTPIHPPVPGHVPRNHEAGGGDGAAAFFNHMPADLVLKLVGRETFSSYRKFCVEREPVDKCISHYSMLKNSPAHNGGNEDLDWETYVEAGNFPIDTHRYTDEAGHLLVDRVLRYERLNDDLRAIAKDLGFPFERLHATAKSGFRVPIRPTVAQKRRIYDAFARSLEFCDYPAP